MSWTDILKQETIEEYIRNKGYKRVSDKYNGEEVTFKNDEGEEITIKFGYRGGNYPLFMVKHRPKEIIVLDPSEDLHDVYSDGANDVIEASSPEIIQEMIKDFITTKTWVVTDTSKIPIETKLIKLPPRE